MEKQENTAICPRCGQVMIAMDEKGALTCGDERAVMWACGCERVAETLDSVNHPDHYTAGKIECIDALAAATVGLEGLEAVCTASAIKYLWRWKRKNGAEDLRNAKWYIDRLINRLQQAAERPEQDTHD